MAAQQALPFLCTYLLRLAPDVGPASKKKLLAEADDAGRNALLLAASSGPPALVSSLLASRADPAAPSVNGSVAVHASAAAGQESLLELLCDSKADLTACDSNGRNALFYAAAAGHVDLCAWLSEKGLTADSEDNTERTPVHDAASAGHTAVVEILLSCCAATSGADAATALVRAGDWEGFEPSHCAVRHGHAQVCEFLAERRANLAEGLDFGVTPLQIAAEQGHEAVLALLLQPLSATQAVLAAIDARVADSRGAWLVAAGAGHTSCCQLIWKAAAEESRQLSAARDRDARNALLLAARGGHIQVAEWILKEEASEGLAVVDACGWTPLHLASAEGHREAVKWLLNAGADLTILDEDGKTAREWAGLRGHLAVESLLKNAEKASAASK